MALQLSRCQFLHAGIEGHQNTASFARLPEEHSIRPLSMSPHSGSHQLQLGGYLAIQGPEFVPYMAGGLAQNVQRGGGTHRTLGQGGIREQAQHAKLGQHIGGPGVLARFRKPRMRGGMAFMTWPDQCEQNVDIRQMALHSSSASSRTRSLVIAGRSSGASKTGNPFTLRIPT